MTEQNENIEKWSVKEFLVKVLRIPVLLVRGELLLVLGVEKYIFHILYTFLLICIAIWISLEIDSTLLQVENNNKRLRDLQIELTEKRFDVTSLERRSNVEASLKKMKSAVAAPEKPACTVNPASTVKQSAVKQ